VRRVQVVINLALDVNPVPQGRAVVVRREGARPTAFTPDRTAAFYEEFRWACRGAGVRRPVQGQIALTLRLWRRAQASHRGDLSNMIKAIEDAGNGFLWDDDRQIDRINAEIVAWGPAVRGRIEIEIEPFDLEVSA